MVPPIRLGNNQTNHNSIISILLKKHIIVCKIVVANINYNRSVLERDLHMIIKKNKGSPIPLSIAEVKYYRQSLGHYI